MRWRTSLQFALIQLKFYVFETKCPVSGFIIGNSAKVLELDLICQGSLSKKKTGETGDVRERKKVSEVLTEWLKWVEDRWKRQQHQSFPAACWHKHRWQSYDPFLSLSSIPFSPLCSHPSANVLQKTWQLLIIQWETQVLLALQSHPFHLHKLLCLISSLHSTHGDYSCYRNLNWMEK